MFNGGVTTEKRLKKFKLSDGKCKVCKAGEENIIHLLNECGDIKELWIAREIEVGGIKIKTDFNRCFFARIGDNEGEIEATFYSTLLWEIWKRRNDWKFNEIKIGLDITKQRAMKITEKIIKWNREKQQEYRGEDMIYEPCMQWHIVNTV